MARLLLVDDDPDLHGILAEHLETSGHTVTAAHSGPQALTLARQRQPDLVILDALLADRDGFEPVRELKLLYSGSFLPIVLVNGPPDASSKQLAFSLGADDFVNRPVDCIELEVRVATLLALRQRHLSLTARTIELMELQRFKDEMSSTVVHDLKNPLAVVMANLAFVLEETGAADEMEPDVRAALQESQMAAERLMRLLTNLADVTRLEANRIQPLKQRTPLALVLHAVAAQRQILARSREVRLDVEVHEDLESEIDVDLVTRAIENVVDNALRYTVSGGQIALSLERHKDQAELCIGNDGSPVPEPARDRIFEKFGQGGRGGRLNLGLGLYFCRLVAEAHGGALTLRQTDRFQTLFCFSLPIAERRA